MLAEMYLLLEILKGFISSWSVPTVSGKSQPFNPDTDIPDLSGKVVLVTGGNNGLGYQSCRQFAKKNAQVYLAARTPAKAEAAISEIKADFPDVRVTFLQLDLASLASVKKAADALIQSSHRLDILMNNAGIMATPPGFTDDGYEIQFGTNHVGHALLTKLLLPTLLKTAEQSISDVRVVNLSSDGYRIAPSSGIALRDVKTDMAGYSTWLRYGQTKLANVLFTKALAQRYPCIKSVVLHPGVIKTSLQDPFQKNHSWATAIVGPITDRMLDTPQKGVLNQLYVATSPEVKSGSFYYPVGKETGGWKNAQDPKQVEELWDWTEQQLKEHGY